MLAVGVVGGRGIHLANCSIRLFCRWCGWCAGLLFVV